jgi:hypothetical protein
MAGGPGLDFETWDSAMLVSVASVGEQALSKRAIGVYWRVPGGELPRHPLIESAGKLKVDSCVLIRLRCGGEVELAGGQVSILRPGIAPSVSILR